jgi:hypothetical protein
MCHEKYLFNLLFFLALLPTEFLSRQKNDCILYLSWRWERRKNGLKETAGGQISENQKGNAKIQRPQEGRLFAKEVRFEDYWAIFWNQQESRSALPPGGYLILSIIHICKKLSRKKLPAST